jgi:GT2 family glycosyltransferase
MTDLSIVIPTRQRLDSLRLVLQACGEQTLSPDRYEVIVAIDGTTDGTEPMLGRLRLPYRLRWTVGPQGGPGAARNRGAALAQSEILLFLDDDILLTASLLAEHLAGHKAGGNQVCLGQVRTWPDRPLSHWERYLNQRYEEHYEKLGQPGYQPDFWDCLSGNLSLPRALFSRSRGFDPAFAAAKHDDIEFGYRLNNLGVQFCYRPAALGYHRFVKDVDAGLGDAQTNGASAVRLAHFHPQLTPPPVSVIYQHYPALFRFLLCRLLRQPARQARWTAWARRLLYQLAEKPASYQAKRPFFRLAYHLHFWQGVCAEATPEDWTALLND